MKTCVLLSLFATALFGQSESGRASCEGTIVDPTGKAVEGATLLLKSSQTGATRRATSQGDGKFRLSALPVGSYSIEAQAPGFAAYRAKNLELTVGQTATLQIALQIESVSTAITVDAATEIVNRADTSNSTTIGERAIERLPIRGRNFAEFIQLTPGVMQEGNRNGIVVNGQRSINSNISVDGVDFNDSLQGGQRGGGPQESAYFFPQLAVREFQVVRDGASAEVGRTNSGYVNVVTKSGTNNYHGEGFYANRNGSLTSKDAFNNDASNNSQHQLGFSAGGPIRTDKLFFFAAVEKNLLTIPYTVKFNTPSGNIAVPADIKSQEGTFNQKNNPLVAFGRLDYQWSPATTLNVQYTYAAQHGLNFGGVSGQTSAASTNNTILDRASQGIKGALTTVLSPSLLHDFRFQYAYDNRKQAPNSTLAEVVINDFGTLGGSKNGTYIYNATRIQFIDNLTWNTGRHTIKAGVDANISPQQQQRETNYGGAYTFNTLADYLAAVGGNNAKVSRYQQSIAANGTQGRYKGKQQDYAGFITDTFRLRPSLTLTAGLRYEAQINPQPTSPNPKYPITGQIPNDLKMFQPRVGLAWNVDGRGRSVIRISSGLFTARTPGYLMQRIFTDNGLNTLILDSGTDASILNFLKVPNPFPSLPTGIRTPINSIYAFDPSFRNPRSGQIAVALEKQITRHTKITIGYTRSSTWNLQRRYDSNLFPTRTLPNGLPVYPTFDASGNLVYPSSFNAVTGLPVFVDSTGRTLTASIARPDPTIGQINENKSVAHSRYDGLQLSLQRRMSRRVQFGVNYTYAFNHDDDSNERDFNRQTTLDTFNLTRDASFAKNDIRHNGNLNMLYNIGRGFTVSTLFFARTGVIVKPVVGVDTQNDGNTVNDRPVINGQVAARDAFRQPGFLSWDLRLLKEFKVGERMQLTFSAEAFNITRSTNKAFNGDGETTFGRPTATINANTGLSFANNTALIPTFAPGTDRFGGPRQMQLGVRVRF